MSRHVPKYRKHANGQAFIQHRSINRPANRLYLGKYGSEASKVKYREALRRIELQQSAEAVQDNGAETISELVLLYRDHAKRYYSQSDEAQQMGWALNPLWRLYGSEPAAEFGPKMLKAVRESMITERLARSTINQRINRIRRFFRWCTEEEYVPVTVWQALQAVAPLHRGKTEAPEPKPVLPVSWADVAATLPALSGPVASMVRFQFFCGCRPGEACIVRPMDLKQEGDTWLYLPRSHKNTWRDQHLVKGVPRAAQHAIKEWLDRSPESYLFSPREAYEEIRSRKAWGGRHAIGERYRTDSYRRAVKYGIDKANEARTLESLPPVPAWSPNQLRHAVATEVSQAIGEQAAQRWCGHKNLETTGIYVERQTAELIQIAEQLDPIWSSRV